MAVTMVEDVVLQRNEKRRCNEKERKKNYSKGSFRDGTFRPNQKGRESAGDRARDHLSHVAPYYWLLIHSRTFAEKEMLESKIHLKQEEAAAEAAYMSDQVPLYNTCLSQVELDSLIGEIRSTSYIDEIESGEQPREGSDLWNIIVPVKEASKDDSSFDSLIKHAGSKTTAIVIANDKTQKSVLVIQVENGAKKDELKVVPKDVIEICSNLMAGNLDLSGVSLKSNPFFV